MKAARLLLIGISVFALLVLAALAVALNSSIQTWAARRALAGQADVHGTIGSVSAGLQHTELRDVKLESRGAVLTLPAADVDVPLIAAGLQKRVAVKRLVAKGWTLDLTKAVGLAAHRSVRVGSRVVDESVESPAFSLLPSAYAAQPATLPIGGEVPAAVFSGVFAGLQLPVDLSLDAVELEGDVILPPQAGRGTTRLRVVLRGGGLAAGAEGKFVVDIAGAASEGGAMTLHGTIGAVMDTPRTFTRLSANIDTSVSGTQFPDGVRLHGDASATRGAQGESYTLLLSGAAKQLVSLKADLITATSRIGGAWQVDLRDSDLAPFLLGKKLPTFTAAGDGTFETGVALDEIHAAGSLKGSADKLEAVSPELSSIGATSLVADFDVLQHGDSLRVERLDATLSGAAPVARVHGLQSFEFNLKSGELRVADPAQELVGISLSGIPLAWARAFLGDIVLSGGDVRGEFALSAREGGLGLRPKSPLTISQVSVGSAKGPLLRDVDVSLNASADYTPRGWQGEIKDLSLAHKGATLLKFDGRAGQLVGPNETVKATGRWMSDLTGWLQQPVTAGNLQLSSGRAEGEFSASLDGTKALEAKLVLKDLVAATKEKLPVVNVDVRADIAADGKASFNVPLVFDVQGRKSDMLLVGTLTPGATPEAPALIDAKLSGEKVIVQDVQMLALLAPAETAPAPAAGGPDVKPFWGVVSGQVTLALRKVIYGESFEVSDVGGTLRLEPGSMKFENVRAVFGPESDLKIAGGMNFDPKSKTPYGLAADVALTNFDTGPAFKAVDPAKLPTIEARVNFTGRITGEGENLTKLAEHAKGRFDVSSKGGIFRALSTILPSDRAQAAQGALSMVSGLFGGSTAGDVLKTTNEIVKYVSEIPFDQLNVSAERDPQLNILLKDFSLISPDLRLGGEGTIGYVAGKSILQQALDLRITLGARGRFGELLNQVKMLKAEKDNLGYTAFVTPIKIGGTLAHTDNSDFKTKLMNIAIEKSGVGDAFNRLLGGGK